MLNYSRIRATSNKCRKLFGGSFSFWIKIPQLDIQLCTSVNLSLTLVNCRQKYLIRYTLTVLRDFEVLKFKRFSSSCVSVSAKSGFRNWCSKWGNGWTFRFIWYHCSNRKFHGQVGCFLTQLKVVFCEKNSRDSIVIISFRYLRKIQVRCGNTTHYWLLTLQLLCASMLSFQVLVWQNKIIRWNCLHILSSLFLF